MDGIRVRKGRAADLAQVREFTKDTFSWGDYLPKTWNAWVRSERGQLLVAVSGKTVLGTVNLRLLEHREAWLEGLRVRHEFRKQGVASLLIEAVHTAAKHAGCRVIRLETGAHNSTARHTFEKFGYQLAIRYGGFLGKVGGSGSALVRPAKLADVPRCWSLWQASWLRRTSKEIVPSAYGWRWWKLTRDRLAEDVRCRRVRMTQNAFICTREEDDGLDITLLVGAKGDALRLLDDARAVAAERAKEHLFWIVPQVRRAVEWASAAGMNLDEDGLMIYELAL